MSNGDFQLPFKVLLNKKNKKNGQFNIFDCNGCIGAVQYCLLCSDIGINTAQ